LLRTGSMLGYARELVEEVPDRLGPYRLLDRIGEGGMGVVFLAEQDPPLKRLVAGQLPPARPPGRPAVAPFPGPPRALPPLRSPRSAPRPSRVCSKPAARPTAGPTS